MELYEKEDYLNYIKQWKKLHDEEIKNGKCKKMFTENLPKRDLYGKQFLYDLWQGYRVYYIYKNNNGWMDIIKVDIKNKEIFVKCNNKEYCLSINKFKSCTLTNIFNKIYASSNIEVKERTSEFKINIGQTFKDEKRDLIIINREKRKYRKFIELH